MALHFLLDDAELPGEVGDIAALTGAEAHHAAVVRRVRVGEAVTLGDGRGAWLTGVVESVAPKDVRVRIESRRGIPRPAKELVLVQALAKGDRDELAVQAATELGVDEIVPWQSARSVSRWDAAKSAKGVARWSAIVREAAKQAHRAWVPDVHEPVATSRIADLADLVLVLEPTASTALTAIDVADAARIALVVGPEGGITPEEIAALAAAGARAVRLGDTVLRTSTAGPAAIAVASALLGRW
ncbi:MAG: 16S rRNA (uracil(1498)-N(3))-methyltransferase [Candidatus Microbacterium phytovorans]|uniref:Ribosomal RNA small subunit methyltransferase E n=1 Tax=Candidatus Microbacterium phytovorans TaxID=3121374 RepID=A0AAJ6B4J9_9MICO|nr:16S rRNA (uracil(1498)-N(3))-methyltransferase [Microbacterium sp.]WEK14422.1 MAG: 16S rRNA (uracil(1498)-N(3))-methyltransferase [Microbacterium sp.]